MFVISGALEFKPDDREFVLAGLRAVTSRSREDAGCVEYWWAEDVEHANRFRFFECWASREEFEAHRAQAYEADFMTTYVSRITGAEAHKYDVSSRNSAIGEGRSH